MPTPLVKHAIAELERVGETQERTEGIVEVVAAFERLNLEGLREEIIIRRIMKILRGENLTPLTNDPEEWAHIQADLWQSKRNINAYSKDGGDSFTLLSTGSARYISKDVNGS